MAGVNKVILIGNLGRDPELRYTPGGQAVANFTLATTENWTSKAGEREERTEWHRIVAWGRTAEICAQYLAKGRSVYIEGRIQTREWENKEGQKQRTTEIQAATVQFLGAPRGGATGQPGQAPGQAPGHAAGPAQTARPSERAAGAGEPSEGGSEHAPAGPPPDEEIPF